MEYDYIYSEASSQRNSSEEICGPGNGSWSPSGRPSDNNRQYDISQIGATNANECFRRFRRKYQGCDGTTEPSHRDRPRLVSYTFIHSLQKNIVSTHLLRTGIMLVVRPAAPPCSGCPTEIRLTFRGPLPLFLQQSTHFPHIRPPYYLRSATVMMARNTPSDAKCFTLLLSTLLLSASAFILPGSLPRPTSTSRRRVAEHQQPFTKVAAVGSTCWGIRRRPAGRYMMSMLPGDHGDGVSDADAEDADAEAADAPGEEVGADAGAGGESRADPDERDDTDEPTDEAVAPLSLLEQGDSLPLSYRSDNGTRESEFFIGDDNENVNPYYDVVRRLSPTELIGRFMKTSSPKVQEAVRTTVLGLLGSLPRHAFETTAIATGDALANLMFQLQMTGYMFKNAEYRLSLQSSMRASAALPPGKNTIEEMAEDADPYDPSRMEMDDEDNIIVPKPKISGKIKLTFNADKPTKQEMEVDADAYMAELRGQVEQLESQLLTVQNQKEEALQQDLLVYIKSMPEHQLKGLTTGVSPEVLESMQLLVETVMGGMGNREILSKTLTQQTGSGMAQLCMWQLVVGFNLREMEAREDMRKNFNK